MQNRNKYRLNKRGRDAQGRTAVPGGPEICDCLVLGPRAQRPLQDRTGLKTALAEATQSRALFCFLFKKTTGGFVESRTYPGWTPGGSGLGCPRGPVSPLQQGSADSAPSQAAS